MRRTAENAQKRPLAKNAPRLFAHLQQRFLGQTQKRMAAFPALNALALARTASTHGALADE